MPKATEKKRGTVGTKRKVADPTWEPESPDSPVRSTTENWEVSPSPKAKKPKPALSKRMKAAPKPKRTIEPKSFKKILKAQQSSPKPQVVVATIDVDTPPRQQTPEVKKEPEVQQKPEVVVKQEVVASTSSASTSSASTSKAATRYVYRVEEYYHRRCFRHLTMFFFFTLCPSSAVVESKSKDT